MGKEPVERWKVDVGKITEALDEMKRLTSLTETLYKAGRFGSASIILDGIKKDIKILEKEFGKAAMKSY